MVSYVRRSGRPTRDIRWQMTISIIKLTSMVSFFLWANFLMMFVGLKLESHRCSLENFKPNQIVIKMESWIFRISLRLLKFS